MNEAMDRRLLWASSHVTEFTNLVTYRQLSYTSGMSTREDLEKIAAYMHNLPSVRAETVARAREEGMTWREIASILGMTEHGLIKAQKRAGKA